MNTKTRKERDVLGELMVPERAYWGISTQRGMQNFRISGRMFPETFLLSLAKVKKACLMANLELGAVDKSKASAMLRAVDEIIEKREFLDQFPLDVFQTGSGTQINMNMNEVLANRANEILGYPLGKKFPVHPNDDVNRSQSSNDVIPTAMHLCILELLRSQLFPALEHLRKSLRRKIVKFRDVVKVGRTHFQDAVPIRLSTEFEVYERQVLLNQRRFKHVCEELYFVSIGGTAVGTGIGAEKQFGKKAVLHLRQLTGFPFKLNPVKAEGIASHSSIVRASGALRLLALSTLKMANDIRWMASGPRAGLGELTLPVGEQGSSIMPRKVNPTQAEALIQVCLQVVGNDTAVCFAEGFGSVLDLNVTKPLMITNIVDSVSLLANGITSFVDNCLDGLKANVENINVQLEKNLMVATNLVPLIGYDMASEIAQEASRNGRTIREVASQKKLKIKEDLDKLLDPRKMV